MRVAHKGVHTGTHGFHKGTHGGAKGLHTGGWAASGTGGGGHPDPDCHKHHGASHK